MIAEALRLIQAADRLRLLRHAEAVTGRRWVTHTDVFEVDAAFAGLDGRTAPRSSGRRR